MPACARVELPPDPLLIARSLAASGEPFALLHASEQTSDPLSRFSFVATSPDRRSERLDPLADDPEWPGEAPRPPVSSASAGAGQSLLHRAPRWIGVLPYDARRDLERPLWSPPDRRPPASIERVEWRRFRAVACVDHERGEVFIVGMERGDAVKLAAMLDRRARYAESSAAPWPRRPVLEIADDEPLARHVERIVAAKELIARGDLYQVNVARRIRVMLREGAPLSVYERLARAAPTPLGAFLCLANGATVLSTSPELFLAAEPSVDDGRASMAGLPRFGPLLTAPIKGTRPRGTDAAADDALVRDLDADPKERAELTMIIDVERNDLGRVATFGSVRLIRPPHVVTHRTVHHRLALVGARARPDATRAEVIEAMLPSGSVTGAPKVRAMEVIASLEPRRRGLYTGAFGCVGHGGGLLLAMAIRTLVMTGDEGEYFTGGGIVADSDPGRELEETRWKALQLERAASR